MTDATEDSEKFKISVFRECTKKMLSDMLNTEKVLPSAENNMPRDWRSLSSLLNYKLGYDRTDPIGKILKDCQDTTIAYFIQCLEQIDRYDVIDDTKNLIDSDIIFFKEQSLSLVPKINDNFEILSTNEDFYATTNKPPPEFHAFLLFDDKDYDLARQMVDYLERNYNLKLCLEQRDLSPGTQFVYHSVIKLISEFRLRLIIILSENFKQNPYNLSVMREIQSLGIKQRTDYIIPCVFGEKDSIPEELNNISKIYFIGKQFVDPWQKLADHLSSQKNSIVLAKREYDSDCQKSKINESIDCSDLQSRESIDVKREYDSDCQKSKINESIECSDVQSRESIDVKRTYDNDGEKSKIDESICECSTSQSYESSNDISPIRKNSIYKLKKIMGKIYLRN